MRRFIYTEIPSAVRLDLEEGLTKELVFQELGTSQANLVLWRHAYRHSGAADSNGARCRRV